MVPLFVPLLVTNAMTLSINPKKPNKFFNYSIVTHIFNYEQHYRDMTWLPRGID